MLPVVPHGSVRGNPAAGSAVNRCAAQYVGSQANAGRQEAGSTYASTGRKTAIPPSLDSAKPSTLLEAQPVRNRAISGTSIISIGIAPRTAAGLSGIHPMLTAASAR